MKQSLLTKTIQVTASPVAQAVSLSDNRQSLVTRFGDAVDVRNRGTLRLGKSFGTHTETNYAPAVVRIWTDDQCRELSSNDARALAAQLVAAANLADVQNGH